MKCNFDICQDKNSQWSHSGVKSGFFFSFFSFKLLLLEPILGACLPDSWFILFQLRGQNKLHAWCMNAFHPNCLILIETQSELIDRQRTLVHGGCSGYNHWLHLGRIPCPLACGYITKQQTIPRLQPSVLIDNSGMPGFILSFFYWPHIIHTLPHSHQSYLGVMGACHDVLRRPCDGSTAAQPSAGIMTVWVNVVQQSFPRVSVTKITRATSHHCVLFLQKPTEDALLCTSPAVTHMDTPEPCWAPCKAVLPLAHIYIYALMDWHSL